MTPKIIFPLFINQDKSEFKRARELEQRRKE